MCPIPRRKAAWARLAKELPVAHLDAVTETIGLADLPSYNFV